jgi:hypothetical protein
VYQYEPATGQRMARQEDYSLVDVIPVSDPNSSTMAQRVVQYQGVLQMAAQAPQIYNLPELHRQMIDVMGIKNAEKIIPSLEDLEPKDPVSENMDAMTGKQMRAFMYQDHDAHIATHTSFMQNPQIAQAIGQNPMAQQIMGSLQAHIAEHLAFKYRKDIEDKLGVALPPVGQALPEDIEIQLSRLVADASAQVTGQKQQEMAQKQAMQRAQDPVVQMQQQEQARKDQELQLKAQKQQTDDAIRMREQARKERADEQKMAIERAKLELDREEMMLQNALNRQELATDTQIEQAKLRIQEIQRVRGSM